ncbi:hypothetical protein [Roseibium marinum]|uniref:Tat pathway signal sequence domain protein n=1 Tax=Roseibium marinum TaxID=281252 RepID=A0A2S3ULM9_9HYPH|nr:hypothetical protein [Roseibium marinum]POF28379.1 hypothetical protein CLV41_11450 [Roseibium marinum]
MAVRISKSILPALYAGLLGLCATLPVHAQSEAPAITLELNKAEDSGENCRLSFVMTNGTGRPIESAAYELVLFTKDGVINQMSVFDFGALPEGKTVVRQFELPALDCAQAGNLLINGPAGCPADQAPAHCTAPLRLSSRTGFTLTQ